ncbi:hypothetical protein BC938DRAFT_470602 [Jimgerdemannia flammicorona]|uniref:Uncharacterized protein n=1 Tax=Jimgerdemannia flammicorona TaxID=994334 RepID=A0A433QV85_9FUNG|nr:hypothetical protein BC938DRAFT_470602 [Jimgerdemannia flammicorona]
MAQEELPNTVSDICKDLHCLSDDHHCLNEDHLHLDEDHQCLGEDHQHLVAEFQKLKQQFSLTSSVDNYYSNCTVLTHSCVINKVHGAYAFMSQYLEHL